MLQPGTILDRHYMLIRLLGEGGMGSVWEAVNVKNGQQFAVKALHARHGQDKELRERFLREARAALDSRYSGHIIEVHEVVQSEDSAPFLVMELLKGRDLSQIVKKEGALEPKRALNLVIQTCHALAEVHRQGIVHRDIKPENIFITRLPDGSEWVKLLDFGVAKFNDLQPHDEPGLTCEECTIGTPEYMSPEQLSADDIDQRADIYSMGIVLFELIVGEHPLAGTDDLAGLISLVLMGEIDPPRDFLPSIDPGLEAVILKAIAVNRDQRYQDTFSLAAELEKISRGSSASVDTKETFVGMDPPDFLKEPRFSQAPTARQLRALPEPTPLRGAFFEDAPTAPATESAQGGDTLHLGALSPEDLHVFEQEPTDVAPIPLESTPPAPMTTEPTPLEPERLVAPWTVASPTPPPVAPDRRNTMLRVVIAALAVVLAFVVLFAGIVLGEPFLEYISAQGQH